VLALYWQYAQYRLRERAARYEEHCALWHYRYQPQQYLAAMITTLAGGLEVNAKEIQVLICAVLHLRYLCESAERASGHPAMYPPLEEPKPHCQSVQILRLKG